MDEISIHIKILHNRELINPRSLFSLWYFHFQSNGVVGSCRSNTQVFGYNYQFIDIRDITNAQQPGRKLHLVVYVNAADDQDRAHDAHILPATFKNTESVYEIGKFAQN